MFFRIVNHLPVNIEYFYIANIIYNLSIMSNVMAAIINRSPLKGKTVLIEKEPENNKQFRLALTGKIEIHEIGVRESRHFFWRVLFFFLMDWPADSFTVADLSTVEFVNSCYSFVHNAKKNGWKTDPAGIKQWKNKIRKTLAMFVNSSADDKSKVFLTSTTVTGQKGAVYRFSQKYPANLHDIDFEAVWQLYLWTEKVLNRPLMIQDAINPTMASFHCRVITMFRIASNPQSSTEFGLQAMILKRDQNISDKSEKAGSDESKNEPMKKKGAVSRIPKSESELKSKTNRYLDFNEACSSSDK